MAEPCKKIGAEPCKKIGVTGSQTPQHPRFHAAER